MKRYFLFILFCMLAAFYTWTTVGYSYPDADYFKGNPAVDVYTASVGYDRKSGNIVGIQPEMNPSVYSTSERFHRKLESYFSDAQSSGFFGAKTLAVFPDHIGTFLFLAGEKRSVYSAENMGSALSLIASSRPLSYMRHRITSFSESKQLESVIRLKSESVRDIYTAVFSKLASVYQVSILAGSVVLPGAYVQNGKIYVSPAAELKTYSFVFLPDGKVSDTFFVKKTPSVWEKNLGIKEETDKTVTSKLAGTVDSWVAMTEDSLYNSAYSSLSTGFEVLISPSFLYKDTQIQFSKPEISIDPRTGKSLMNDSDHSAPLEILWDKFSLPGKINASIGRIYMQVFMAGKIYEYTLSAPSKASIKYNKTESVDGNRFRSAVLNIWL
ncbi:MAG TPA: hypothetical protein PKV80_26925 [Leptospiraceae bacterium]|nr:hypothetical protein [Leptospiraceae bacterium]HNF28128.1 hypothetical protein [Leptospiraceae bacterium]